MEDGKEWFRDDVPELLRAKVQALKACRSRCLAHTSSDKTVEIATPVMKLCATLLEHSGSLNAEIEEE
jgi:sister-chromatid-cohesion protein PDS5